LAQPVGLAWADVGQCCEVGVAGGQHAVVEADTDCRAKGLVDPAPTLRRGPGSDRNLLLDTVPQGDDLLPSEVVIAENRVGAGRFGMDGRGAPGAIVGCPAGRQLPTHHDRLSHGDHKSRFVPFIPQRLDG
jgi:hypothetical protein